MMASNAMQVDERTVAVQHQAGHAAYVVMSYVALAAMMIRGIRPEWVDANGFPLDLLAIVVAGGATQLVIRWRQSAVDGQELKVSGLFAVFSALVAAVAVAVFLRLR